MSFFSVESAERFIKGKVRDVYRQGPILKNQLIEAGQIIAKLKKRPPASVQTSLRKALKVREDIKATLLAQNELEAEVYPFARFFGVDKSLADYPEDFRGPGLGALPILLAGTAIAVAGMIYNQFRRIANQRRMLDLVGKGVLTAEEAKGLREPGFFAGLTGALGGAQTFLIVGIGLVVFVTAFGTGRTRG